MQSDQTDTNHQDLLIKQNTLLERIDPKILSEHVPGLKYPGKYTPAKTNNFPLEDVKPCLCRTDGGEP